MNWYKTAEISKEMEDFFEKRTKKHISFVQDFCKKIENYDKDRFSGLIERGEKHDHSKYKSPERDPYVYITWNYKCKDEGIDWEPPKDIDEKMNKATEHHVKNNLHHPEAHSDKEVDLINRKDRDKPPKEMIDATKMKDLDVAEMVADWLAMSKERGGDPKDWAKKNVNVCWKFTDEQEDLIYELIEAVWK
jgi:hypothetical protein